MQRLTGKVAWVTGAGSGIGEAGALALARGRRECDVDRAAKGDARVRCRPHRKRVAERRAFMPGDMSRSEDAAAIAEAIEKEFRHLDILVNNAGSNIPDRSWKRLSAAGVDDLIKSNFSSAFHGSLAALPIMRKQKDGVIINVASIAGRFVSTQPGVGYIAAKHGVVALSQASTWRSAGKAKVHRTLPGRGGGADPRQAPVYVSDETRRGCCNRRTSAI